MQRGKADFGLLLVGMLWGLGFVFVKIGLNEGITPFYLLTIRFLVAFIILFVIFRSRLKNIEKSDLKNGFIIATFLFLGFAFQISGAALTTASNNAFFTAINVIIVPYIFWAIHKHVPNIFSFIAAGLFILGVGILSFDSKMQLNQLNEGDILTIISALFFAFHIAFTGFLSTKSEPIKLNVIQMGFASVYSVIGLMIFSNTEKIQILKGMSLVSILYISIFATAVCFFLQTYCQKNTTSTRASILLATESLFAPIFAILLLNESLSIRTMIGAGLILFAVIVSETRLGFKLPEDENG